MRRVCPGRLAPQAQKSVFLLRHCQRYAFAASRWCAPDKTFGACVIASGSDSIHPRTTTPLETVHGVPLAPDAQWHGEVPGQDMQRVLQVRQEQRAAAEEGIRVPAYNTPLRRYTNKQARHTHMHLQRKKKEERKVSGATPKKSKASKPLTEQMQKVRACLHQTTWQHSHRNGPTLCTHKSFRRGKEKKAWAPTKHGKVRKRLRGRLPCRRRGYGQQRPRMQSWS